MLIKWVANIRFFYHSSRVLFGLLRFLAGVTGTAQLLSAVRLSVADYEGGGTKSIIGSFLPCVQQKTLDLLPRSKT
jgi:hypothetical protein